MAEIITAKGTGFFIEKVIRGARERIVLISPYLKVQKLYLDELKSAANKGIRVTVLFREEEAKPDQLDALKEIKNVELFCLSELHAKCYFNEHRFVLTSMNLHDHSERNNKELGIMLEQGIDEALFKQAWDNALRILETGRRLHAGPLKAPSAIRPVSKEGKPKSRSPIAAFVNGLVDGMRNGAYCIRCSDRIPFDMDKPLCITCYREWAQWKNMDYKEVYCHECGEERATSFSKPLCRSCYTKS